MMTTAIGNRGFTAIAPSTATMSFEINGNRCELVLDTRTTLLDALREHLHLTGTKKGCDHGQRLDFGNQG